MNVGYTKEQVLSMGKKQPHIYCLSIDNLNQKVNDLLELGFSKEEILKMTPEMLPVLKKAGVVDAGGRGLLVILTGFLRFLTGTEVDLAMEFESDTIKSSSSDPFEKAEVDYNSLADIEFAYCTEFFVININKKTTI